MAGFKCAGHVQLVQQACFYVFHFDRVLCNQMYIDVHWHIDATNSIAHRNDIETLEKEEEARWQMSSSGDDERLTS